MVLIQRIIAGFLTLVAVLFGSSASDVVLPHVEAWVGAYAYDGAHQVANLANSATERGPPPSNGPAVGVARLIPTEGYGGGALAFEQSRVAANTGMAGVRAAGEAGEVAAGIVKNTQRIPSATGKASYRIPDELNDTTIGEVKNVKHLEYRSQLQDDVAYAQGRKLQFNLYVRQSTTFSGPGSVGNFV